MLATAALCVTVLAPLGIGYFAMSKILPFEKGLHAFFHANHGALMQQIVASGDWNNDIEATFKSGIAEFKKTGSW